MKRMTALTARAVTSLLLFCGACHTSALESLPSNEISDTVHGETPVIVDLPARVVMNKNQKLELPFNVVDPDTANSNLTFSIRSANTTLLPRNRIRLLGTTNGWILQLAPVPYQTGSSRLSITASDGATTTRHSLFVVVTPSNNPPVLIMPAALTTAKETPVAIAGVRAQDVDAARLPLRVIFTASHGVIRVSTAAPGGVIASQVSGNNSSRLTITAPLGTLNRTFAANSLTYRGYRNFVGTDTLTTLLNDLGHTGTGGAKFCRMTTAVEVTGTSLDHWRMQHFTELDLRSRAKGHTVWGPFADPDADGRRNLEEFAFGLNPNIKEPADQAIRASLLNLAGSNYLTVTFKHRRDATIAYVPEVCGNDFQWTNGFDVTEPISAVPLDDSFAEVVYRDRTPITSEGPRMLRLHLTGLQTPQAVLRTEVFGGTATLLGGMVTTTAQLTPFCPQVMLPHLYAGRITSIASNTLYDVQAGWADGQFSGGNYYVEFASGRRTDILESATKSLVLAADISNWLSPGASYRVRKHLALEDIFGAQNSAGLAPGAIASLADNVVLFDAATQQSKAYFYSNDPSNSGWRGEDLSPLQSVIVATHQGILVNRRSLGDLTIFMVGIVRTRPSVVTIFPGINWIGCRGISLPPPVNSLNLFTGNPNTGIAPGASPETADNVMLVRPDGSTTTLFYSALAGSEGWRDLEMNTAAETPVAPQGAFLVLRRAPESFDWTVPTP